MKRINFFKFLTYIGKTLISEWRMFLKIVWLPILLYLISDYLLFFPVAKGEDVKRIAENLTKLTLFYVAFVGIYRYLLADPRFRIREFHIREDVHTGKPGLSLPFYFVVDKSVVLLTAFFMAWGELDIVIRHAIINHTVQGLLHAGIERATYADVLPLYTWDKLVFFLDTQMCLIFPYIAVSRNITSQGVLLNIKALKGSRIWVWLTGAFIYSCYKGVDLFLFSTEARKYFPFIRDNPVVYSVASAISFGALCLSMIATVVFYAALFRDFGQREKS